jgi:hypothetical protein
MPMMPNARRTWLIYLTLSLEDTNGAPKHLLALAFTAQ